MSKPKIIFVVGARPNFVKAAPVIRLMDKAKFDCWVVHTGQHYDENMSKVFFDEFGISFDYNLNVGFNTSEERQFTYIMDKFYDLCVELNPDIVVVFGDVNSSVACALSAKRLFKTLVHIESGLRSNDRSMPEEINRVIVDGISDYFFVTEKSGMDHLKKEGKDISNISFVGNTMIDNLLFQLKQLEYVDVSESIKLKEIIGPRYIVTTIHRKSNVDDKDGLTNIVNILKSISNVVPIVFVAHPKTETCIHKYGLFDIFNKEDSGGLIFKKAMGYMNFLNLWKDASLVITDSGGIQEETTSLKKPCLTIRNNTERPATIKPGSNILVKADYNDMIININKALTGKWKKCSVPELWDGEAANRIVKVLESKYCHD